MFNDIPVRIKAAFIGLITAIFICSMMFVYVFVIDGSVSDDESKAFVYAAIFAAVFIALNAILLSLAYVMVRRAKTYRAGERTYLDPKGTKEKEIRPKE